MRKFLHNFFLICFFFVLSNPANTQNISNSSWPMFGHDSMHTHRGSSVIPVSREEKKVFHADHSICFPVIGNDGTIFVATFNHYIYAIKPDGSLKWEFKTEGILNWSAPAIGEDGTIYIGAMDSLLYAINPNGSLKWKYKTDGEISSFTTIGFDGTIYICPGKEYVYAINPDGSLKWKIFIPNLNERSPAVDIDNSVYVCSRDSLYALDSSGAIRWKCYTDQILLSPPAIGDGAVYVAAKENSFIEPGYIFAIDHHNGTVKWKYETTGFLYIGVSIAIGADGTIYIGSVDYSGTVADVDLADYYLNAINTNGTEKWKFKTGRIPLKSSISVGGDGCIYISSHMGASGGGIVAVNTDGTLRWNRKSEGGVPEFSVIGGDGTLYYCSGPALYALEPEQSNNVDSRPISFVLCDPYPNPFNSTTTLEFTLPVTAPVKIEVYTATGQKVATLVDGPMSAGAHSVTFDGSKYASGVYFYRFESAGLNKSGKMLLLK